MKENPNQENTVSMKTEKKNSKKNKLMYRKGN